MSSEEMEENRDILQEVSIQIEKLSVEIRADQKKLKYRTPFIKETESQIEVLDNFFYKTMK